MRNAFFPYVSYEVSAVLVACEAHTFALSGVNLWAKGPVNGEYTILYYTIQR